MSAGLVVGAILLAAGLLAGLVWIFGSRARARLAARHPAPGQMVDVGGYRMHIQCQGVRVAAGPTVVLEAAHSEMGLSWASVQPEVAKFARVVSYDRAGLGWSEPSPRPRTADNIVNELHTLLARAGVEPPYVLVGHSIGGMYARLYAHEHPAQVAGMVLVDATHEEQFVRMPEAIAKKQAAASKGAGLFFGLFQAMTTLGLLAPLAGMKRGAWPMPIPEEARSTYLGVVYSSRHHLAAARQETLAMFENLALVRARRLGSLGDIPLTVISAGQPPIAAGHGISEADAARLTALAEQVHAEMAALSTRGKRVIAEGSGHYVQVSQPALVVDAIREVVEAARR